MLALTRTHKNARLGPGGVVEAAGLEPASASAPSARFYERSSRSCFACLGGPMRRCYLGSGESQIVFGVCCFAGVLRVSSKLGSSRRTRTAHVETGTPP